MTNVRNGVCVGERTRRRVQRPSRPTFLSRAAAVMSVLDHRSACSPPPSLSPLRRAPCGLNDSTHSTSCTVEPSDAPVCYHRFGASVESESPCASSAFHDSLRTASA